MSTAAPLQKLAAKPKALSNSTYAGLLVQRKCACGSPTASLTGECAECKSSKLLQTKLAIGASNDPLEQEADRVADQVLAAPANPAVSHDTPHIQRFTGQSSAAVGTAPASVEHVLATPGRPLNPVLRQDMERRFGHEFSRVRVHSGGAAEQSALDVNAHAYTVNQNIVFGAGRFAPGTLKGRRLIAHELTHVVQQNKGSRCPQQVQRDDPAHGGAPPKPEWAITSSDKPLPGVPVPGYEQPKASYSELDRDALEQALRSRVAENEGNADNFLGEYGSALVDLWARYATEAMAEAADEAGWSLFGKLLKFVITESLTVISGAWAARYVGKLSVLLVQEITAATGEVATEIAGEVSAKSDIHAGKVAIDRMTKHLADEFKSLPNKVRKLGSSAVAVVDYTSWLKDATLNDLERFRIPPAFPHIPTEFVRAAVAQAIVGLLHGSSSFILATTREQFAYGFPGTSGYHVYPAKNVISMKLEIGPGGYMVYSGSRLVTSQILAKELYGRPIKEMPKIPLHITLVSSDSDVAVVKAALGGLQRSLKQTFEPTEAIIGYVPGSYSQVEPQDAFLRAYASKSPAVITRDVPGHISETGGGVLEHLYLYNLANRRSETLESVIGKLDEQHISREREEGDLDTALGLGGILRSKSEQLSPEELASEVFAHLLRGVDKGAEDLISKAVESKLNEPRPTRSVR